MAHGGGAPVVLYPAGGQLALRRWHWPDMGCAMFVRRGWFWDFVIWDLFGIWDFGIWDFPPCGGRVARLAFSGFRGTFIRQSIMRVILIAAQSLDGRITFHETSGAAFASEADRLFFREALAGFDCSVMGGGTFRVSEKRIRERAADGRLLVIMTGKASEGGGAFEGREGVVEFSSASPGKVIAGLRARGMKRCALLGGGRIYGAFLAAGLVDEVWLTLEPRIFGAGVPLAGGVALDTRLKLLSSERLSASTLLLKYEVAR